MSANDECPDLRRRKLIPCLDSRGEPAAVGAGITHDDEVVLLGPTDGAAVCTEAQLEQYLAVVTEMLVGASTPADG